MSYASTRTRAHTHRNFSMFFIIFARRSSRGSLSSFAELRPRRSKQRVTQLASWPESRQEDSIAGAPKFA